MIAYNCGGAMAVVRFEIAQLPVEHAELGFGDPTHNHYLI